MDRPDFTKMTVAQVRELYCSFTGDTEEQAKAIGTKSDIVERLLPYYPEYETSGFLQEVEMEGGAILLAGNNAVNMNTDSDAPSRGSAEWQDYVMGLLTTDEYAEKGGKKYPKAAGLRRLVELLLGPIVESGPCGVWLPNVQCSTVQYKMVIRWSIGSSMLTQELRTFSEIADTSPANTPEEFAKYPSATACSRAAGRAYRAALLLAVNTAEEMAAVIEPETVNTNASDELESVNTTQCTAIRMMCLRLKIDLAKLLEFNGGKKFEDMTKADGRALLAQLNAFGTSGKDSLEIPDCVRV